MDSPYGGELSMSMPPWRETARQMFPELLEEIAEAENPWLFWFDLRDAFRRAYDASPRDESLIRRIYAYSDWCFDAPRGKAAADDLATCAALCFWEHIPMHPAARDDMPRWFTLEEIVYSKGIFSYLIGDERFRELEEHFRRSAHVILERDRPLGPEATENAEVEE
jgi:hypothetical protein